MPVNLPTTLLRSFVAIVDTGSMLSASGKVFVTQSALSLQIKRLEEMLQQSLFHREGRRLTLTQAGELMLDYARKVLLLHDEAVATISAGGFGRARLGVVQDFSEDLLSGLLVQFARLYPGVRIHSRTGETDDLLDLLDRRQLDIVLGFADEQAPHAVAHAAMAWYGRADLAQRAIVPLVVLQAPCRFRSAAIRALEAAGTPYRIAVEAPDLATLRGSLDAGLGITCRTDLCMKEPALRSARLPSLPQVACIVRAGSGLDASTQYLAQMTREVVSVM